MEIFVYLGESVYVLYGQFSQIECTMPHFFNLPTRAVTPLHEEKGIVSFSAREA